METKKSQLFLFFFTCFCVFYSNGIDTITKIHPIKDSESIISSNNMYELGFFSPINTTNRYVGIWLPEKAVVWVANRDRPLNDSSGILKISEDGNLVLLNGENKILWSTGVVSNNALSNSTAQLLDSGNLVLFGNSNGSTLWESFQFPTDSLLENMKILSDKNTKEISPIRSWKSPSDPTVGSFSAGINPLTIPDVFVWNHDRPYWRSGPWDGKSFIGIPSMYSVYLNGFTLVDNHKGQVYLTYAYGGETPYMYFVLTHEGLLLERFLNRDTKEWETTWNFPESECDYYGRCGPFGTCNSKATPMCSCLRGYTPKYVKEWDIENFTSGCVRKVPFQCESDGFWKMKTMKVPVSPDLSFVEEEMCRSNCLTNCSCIAYSYNEGIGCMSWTDILVDIQKFSTMGTNLYIRVPSSELDEKKYLRMVIAISAVAGSIALALCAYFSWLLILKQKGKENDSSSPRSQRTKTKVRLGGVPNQVKLEELPLFKLKSLSTATDNFSEKHKLGQGGFGTVYKGKLEDGKKIAVKRLSRSSDQGVEEFMNEVKVISKLQHRNLVRLLGCCIQEEEKLLIYEYLPNKSLDAFLFDPEKQELLDWRKRMSIIEGIGRGLLYLHRDSRLRIIHRDLKASNILLDEELNPKISDFGTAKIFGGSDNKDNTQRVIGTYGYMAPEYAMSGQFSEKSDVFSFGVLLLEIVSGRRNTSFYHDDKYLSLLQYAWKMYDEDNILAIVDPRIACKDFEVEMSRCIYVGLLCVQELTVDRPIISTVLSMLSKEVTSLAKPKQAAYLQRPNYTERRVVQQIQAGCSLNDCSITSVEGR